MGARSALPVLSGNPTVYGPDGCSYHAVCETCPLPACLYDGPAWAAFQREERDRRDAEIRAARAAGATEREVKARFRVSAATIRRALGTKKR